MKINISLFLSIFMLLCLNTSCQDELTEPNPDGMNNAGKLLFTNGNIYTVNPNQEWVEAIYIEDGVIVYVGDNATAQSEAGDSVEAIDLEGAFMMPGIHDVHLHPLEAATSNFQFLLEGEVESLEDYADDIAKALEENPGDGWLLGWGHDLSSVIEADRLPKTMLDELAPDRPIGIMERTSHSLWCNSAALRELGIDTNTPDPAGGIIMRESNGEANGILIDNAGNMLIAQALTPTPEREARDYQGLVEFGLPELAKHGITSISDARTYWKRNHHKIWQRLADEDQLTVRANLGLWAYPEDTDDAQIATIKSLYKNDKNSLLKINQIKLYSDGIIHNTTSAMHDDYHIDYFEKATNNGLNYFTEDRLAKYIAALEPTGFDFHIHTIGNRGVHESLNAIERSGTAAGRHRLTHVEFVDPADYQRFAQLNVTADAQVAGEFTQPEFWSDNDYLIGSALTQNVIPLRSLADVRARITLSSDWDVSTLNPFVGLQNAVTRTPQALSLKEAIAAYTINAAYVMRQEEVVGTLEVGKEADFLILDKNLFEIAPTEIGKVQVLETYLAGELIYEK